MSSLSLRGDAPGQGKKLPAKVTSSALVVCRMDREDGTGKGPREGAEDFQSTENE